MSACTSTPWPAPTATIAELVGLIEPNPGRLAVHVNRLAEAGLDMSGVLTGRSRRAGERDRQSTGRSGDHHLARLHPCRADREMSRRRRRRRGGEAADHRPGRHPADRRGGRPLRAAGGGDAQLPLLAAQLRSEGARQVRRDRHTALGHLRMGARHRTRCGLLPPVAPGQGQLRRSADPQGVPPLRSGQLAARRLPRSGVRPGRGALLRLRERRRPRHGGPPRARHPRRQAQPVGAGPPRGRPAQGALSRQRVVRRLPPRPGRVRSWRDHRGQPRRDRRLRPRRDAELRAQCARTVGGLPDSGSTAIRVAPSSTWSNGRRCWSTRKAVSWSTRVPYRSPRRGPAGSG